VTELRRAISFLTIVPGGDGSGFGAIAFPAVGLALGVGAVALHRLLGFGAPWLAALAVIVFWMIATGAIHYDGLADACDGLGGRTVEDRLRLMAEGSIGAFGMLGLLVSFSTRLFALVELGARGDTAAALLVAPTLARAALVAGAFHMPAARPGGLGDAFVATLDRRTTGWACAFAGGVALFVGGGAGVAAALVVGLATLGIRSLARRLLGGTTGDVIGATGEVTETLALVVFAIGGSA
jgi:adenosylcobinamide-GDP ribazoletransferase